jgi:hypothetical protein
MPEAAAPLPVSFPVFLDDEPVSATLDFASHADVLATTRWRVPRTVLDAPARHSRAADARELAMLAAKRWRHYRTSRTVAYSLAHLRQLMAADADGEYCFHLKATAGWFPASLGGAMVRRTWCHHLMLDFLFVHPAISGRKRNVRGVGLGLFQAVCMLAHALRCPQVWGEATRDSAGFYRRQLHRVVRDRFEVKGKEIARFAAEFMARATP